MPLGLLTGLGAALAWGILDIFSALASRRIGSLKVTTGIQVIGAAFVIVLALVTGTSLPDDIRVIIGCAFVVDLPDLGGRKKLESMGMDVHALCAFEGL